MVKEIPPLVNQVLGGQLESSNRRGETEHIGSRYEVRSRIDGPGYDESTKDENDIYYSILGSFRRPLWDGFCHQGRGHQCSI